MAGISFGSVGLVNALLNLNSATVVKKGAGAVISAVVTVAGTVAGGIYDTATTGGGSTGNLIATLPASLGPVAITFPCFVGITVVPGSGQSVSIAYQ
jgi:hypothetical protein